MQDEVDEEEFIVTVILHNARKILCRVNMFKQLRSIIKLSLCATSITLVREIKAFCIMSLSVGKY